MPICHYNQIKIYIYKLKSLFIHHQVQFIANKVAIYKAIIVIINGLYIKENPILKILKNFYRIQFLVGLLI